MLFLKADTSVKVVIGPVVAVGDGFTPVTTLSLSTADEAEIMKHDASAVTDISGNTFTAITSMDGYYNLTLTAAQLDTEGMLVIGINDDSLCLPVRKECTVVNANVYDSLFAAAATDYLQVDAIQLAGTTQDATDLADFAAAGYDPATNKVQGVVLVDTTTTNTDMRGTDSAATAAALATAQTDLDTLTGADGATLATSQPNYTPAVAGDSMALTAGAVDDIWDEPAVGHLTAGTMGLAETLGSAALVDTTVTGTPTSTTLQLTAGSTVDDFYNDQLIYVLSGTGIGQVRVISDYTGATKTVTVDEPWITTPAASDRVAILVSHVHPITQIADQVLDEALSEHTTVGSLGKAIADIETDATAILADTADMQPKLGTPAGADMSADIAAVKAETALIVADTNELQTDWANGGRLDLLLDATALEATVAALNDISVANILTTAMTESYAADGAAPTLAQALFGIQQMLQEASASGTTLTVKKLDGSTTAMTFTLNDATTPTSITRAT